MLEDLLEYHQTPEDGAFVTAVMHRVRRQKRLRRLILVSTGVIGALFGAAGVLILSEPLARAAADIQLMPVSVALVGGVAFLAWLFQDETSAAG